MGMMMRRMRNQGKKPPQKAKEAPPVLVSCTLKAEFPLSASCHEELLLTGHALEEGMKAADLGGTKDLKQASAQDEELAQEDAADMMMGFGGEGGLQPGEPVFLYFSKISEEERAKALAQAFHRAKAQAGQLARAAGVELGTLYHLEDSSAADPGADEEGLEMDGPSSYHLRQLLHRARTGNANGDKESLEAIGGKPGKVSYRITLSVTFELKKPPAK
jgi:hypothetical protein